MTRGEMIYRSRRAMALTQMLAAACTLTLAVGITVMGGWLGFLAGVLLCAYAAFCIHGDYAR